MILFFDTETTGLPNFNERARHPSQPHIVQLAAILTDDDGKEMESHYAIVKPDHWTIPKEASDIHGITDEIAKEYGISEHRVAALLLAMMWKASPTVAHNHQFDKFIARIAMRRYDLMTDADDERWKAMPRVCTMLEMTDICAIPGKFGKSKWPNLREAYKHATGKQLVDAHDALADVRACKEIYFWLKSQAPAGVLS